MRNRCELNYLTSYKPQINFFFDKKSINLNYVKTRWSIGTILILFLFSSTKKYHFYIYVLNLIKNKRNQNKYIQKKLNDLK
jgi:hypothetical protein